MFACLWEKIWTCIFYLLFFHIRTLFFSSVSFLLVRDAAESLQGPATAVTFHTPLSFAPLLAEASENHVSLNFVASLPFAKPVFTFP